MQTFEESLLYEINPYIFAEAGFIWQRISIFELKDRYIPFAGIGSYNLLRDVLDKKKDRLTLNVAYVNVKDVYTPMVESYIRKSSESFDGIYLRGEFTHKFSDTLTYKMEGTLKHALDRTPVYLSLIHI